MFNKILKITSHNLVTAFFNISMIFFKSKSFFLLVLLLNATSSSFAQDKVDKLNLKEQYIDDLFTKSVYDQKTQEVRGELVDENGVIKTIRDFKNNLLVLYFWATWCTDCVNEISSLLKLKHELEYKEITDIKIILLSIDFKDFKNLRAYLNSKKLNDLEFFKDKNKHIMYTLNVDSLPQSFILDENGFIIANFKQVIDWSDDNVLKNLLKLKSKEKDHILANKKDINRKSRSKSLFYEQDIPSNKTKKQITFIG